MRMELGWGAVGRQHSPLGGPSSRAEEGGSEEGVQPRAMTSVPRGRASAGLGRGRAEI